MASSRMIREGLCDSERVAKLGWFAQALFFRLLLKADDFGFYDARPAFVRAQLFSTMLDKAREADVSRALLECERAGLIRFYEVDEHRYLEILRYGQRVRNVKTKFAPPPWWSPPELKRKRQSAAIRGNVQQCAAMCGLDGDGKKEINSFFLRSGCATADAAPPSPVSESVGGDDGEEWVDVFAKDE